MLKRASSPLAGFLLLMLLLFLLSAFGPPERSLGQGVRWVYLHGAWVWTALVGFALAAVVGALGLVMRRTWAQAWSQSIGLTATFFWVTYLPISLWTMRINWNGLFLEEPRWRIGIDFAIIAMLFQLAALVTQSPALASALNIIFVFSLGLSLGRAEQIMHPPSPITSSGSALIEGFFALMLGVCLLAGWQLSRWLQRTLATDHEAQI
jgi:hypothetical protein